MHIIQQSYLIVLLRIINEIVMISIRGCFYTSIIFFVLSDTLQAQSISFGEDRKKILLEGIKPPETNSRFKYNESKSDKINNDDLLKMSKKYKSGGAEFDNKYDLKAFELSLQNLNLFKIDTPTETKMIFTNGKIHQIPVKSSDYQLDKLSQKHRMQGLMLNQTMGGLNLSGWKKKRLSKKSKEILFKVYGITALEE